MEDFLRLEEFAHTMSASVYLHIPGYVFMRGFIARRNGDFNAAVRRLKFHAWPRNKSRNATGRLVLKRDHFLNSKKNASGTSEKRRRVVDNAAFPLFATRPIKGGLPLSS